MAVCLHFQLLGRLRRGSLYSRIQSSMDKTPVLKRTSLRDLRLVMGLFACVSVCVCTYREERSSGVLLHNCGGLNMLGTWEVGVSLLEEVCYCGRGISSSTQCGREPPPECLWNLVSPGCLWIKTQNSGLLYNHVCL